MPKFIRGLWGGEPGERQERWLNKTRNDVKGGLELNKILAPEVYAVGSPSIEYLRSLEIEPRVIVGQPGNFWRTKLLILLAAVREFGEIVWLDWDAKLLKPIPESFWDQLRLGQPLQCHIRQYFRVKCRWRAINPRVLPGGAFIYCRDRSLIERALQVSTACPGLDDEQCMAYVIDEAAGGWRGPWHFYSQGWDPYCYTINGEMYPPQNPIFTAG